MLAALGHSVPQQPGRTEGYGDALSSSAANSPVWSTAAAIADASAPLELSLYQAKECRPTKHRRWHRHLHPGSHCLLSYNVAQTTHLEPRQLR